MPEGNCLLAATGRVSYPQDFCVARPASCADLQMRLNCWGQWEGTLFLVPRLTLPPAESSFYHKSVLDMVGTNQRSGALLTHPQVSGAMLWTMGWSPCVQQAGL